MDLHCKGSQLTDRNCSERCTDSIHDESFQCCSRMRVVEAKKPPLLKIHYNIPQI